MNKIVGDMHCQSQKLIHYPSCLQPMGIAVTCFEFQVKFGVDLNDVQKTSPSQSINVKSPDALDSE